MPDHDSPQLALPAPHEEAAAPGGARHEDGNRPGTGHDKAAHPEQNSGRDDEGENEPPPRKPTVVGGLLLAATVLVAALLATVAILRAVTEPRTDDAEVFANFIGMAPVVEGPIVEIGIRDNEAVHAGQLLFVIDERPYRYALERALSEQATLEGQIEDRRRSINAQISNIDVQRANVLSSRSNRDAMAADVSEAQANQRDAVAALHRAEADRQYAYDNYHRLEPLLKEQFVTVDQVDQARTQLETRTHIVQQMEAQLGQAEARVSSQQSHLEQSAADVLQRRAQREQASNAVEVITPLTNQREEREAAVQLARYNLEHCRVYAPFDGYITNLTTSLGAYVHVGTQVFTVIDARRWWVIANFRETQLKHVIPGSAANVFLMQRDNLPLRGVVESVGFGVTPDPSVAGVVSPGLPTVQRTLDWVHLAARYPVRIRIEGAPPQLLRIGQSAVAVVYPHPAAP